MKTAQHFLYLDLIRGIAALSVLAYHLASGGGQPTWFGGSFLAVDLFFLMSGFVLTHAYEDKLRSGKLDFIGFMKIRLLRLYPLYFIAICMGIGFFVLKGAAQAGGHGILADLALAIPPALLVLPNPFDTQTLHSAYPFAISAWSLAMELWFNVIYAAVAFRFSNRVLGGIVVVSGLLTLFFAYQAQSFNLGWSWETTAGGIARFWFSFPLGILIYRLSPKLPQAGLIALLMIPIGLGYMFVDHTNIWPQAIYVFCLFPILIIAYAHRQPPSGLRFTCDHGGRLSYGLYILHPPLFMIAAGMIKVVQHREISDYSALNWAFVVAIVIGASAVAIYGIDEPLRRALSNRRRRQAAATLTPS